MTLPGFEITQDYQSIEFTVTGRAVPKRFIIVTYGKGEDALRIIKADPKTSEPWMKEIEAEARVARTFSDWVVPDVGVAVVVTITIFKAMADSWVNAKKMRLLGKRVADAPDVDNITNCVHDALQGHRGKLKDTASPGEIAVHNAWLPPVILNDKQIGEEHIVHRWCWKAEERVVIKVEVPGDE